MTLLQNNNKFHIEQGQIKTYDKLPTGTYSVGKIRQAIYIWIYMKI